MRWHEDDEGPTQWHTQVTRGWRTLSRHATVSVEGDRLRLTDRRTGAVIDEADVRDVRVNNWSGLRPGARVWFAPEDTSRSYNLTLVGPQWWRAAWQSWATTRGSDLKAAVEAARSD